MKLLLNSKKETIKILKALLKRSRECSEGVPPQFYSGYICNKICDYINETKQWGDYKEDAENFVYYWYNKLCPNRVIKHNEEAFGLFGTAYSYNSQETRYAFLLNVLWEVEKLKD